MKIKALYIIPFNKKHIFRNLVNWTIVCPHTPPLPHPNQTVSEYSVGMFLLVLVFTVWMLSQLFENVCLFDKRVKRFRKSNFKRLCTVARVLLLMSQFFFYLGFLSRTFTIHRTAGEGGGYLFNSSVPLWPASQTLRH